MIKENYHSLPMDFSALEEKVTAMLGKDLPRRTSPLLLDLHSITAALKCGVLLSDVTPQQRKDAKAINFGLMYSPDAKWTPPPEQDLRRIYTDAEWTQIAVDLGVTRIDRLYTVIQAHFNFNFGKS